MSGLRAFCLMPMREPHGFSNEAKDRKRQEVEAESRGNRAIPTMSQEQTCPSKEMSKNSPQIAQRMQREKMIRNKK